MNPWNADQTLRPKIVRWSEPIVPFSVYLDITDFTERWMWHNVAITSQDVGGVPTLQWADDTDHTVNYFAYPTQLGSSLFLFYDVGFNGGSDAETLTLHFQACDGAGAALVTATTEMTFEEHPAIPTSTWAHTADGLWTYTPPNSEALPPFPALKFWVTSTGDNGGGASLSLLGHSNIVCHGVA